MRMSRFFLLLGLSAALAPVPPAAADIAAIGLKGGLSVATLHGRLPTDGFIENGSKLGFGGGISLTIPLGGILSFQPELLYAAKGHTLGPFDVTDPIGTVVGTAKVLGVIDYVEIPLLARVSIPAGGIVSPSLVVGPAVGLRVSQKLKVTGDVPTITSDIDYFRSADFGVALGAGLELGRSPIRGTLEARYTLGLTRATEDIYSDDARNGNLLVMLGVILRR